VYKDSDDSIEMVQCDCCDKWVHIQCGAIDDQTYKRMKSEDDFNWECPKCKGDVDGDSDDEILEKFPLPKAKRIVDNQVGLENDCSTRLRAILGEVRAVEANFAPTSFIKKAVEVGNITKIVRSDSEGASNQIAGAGCPAKSSSTGNNEQGVQGDSTLSFAGRPNLDLGKL
jgi:hypothetical protein